MCSVFFEGVLWGSLRIMCVLVVCWCWYVLSILGGYGGVRRFIGFVDGSDFRNRDDM